MKEGWEYKTLGECCEKINGLWKGKKEPFVNVGVIRNANFTKEMTLDFSNIEYLYVEEKQFKTRKLRKGDLIVEKSGGSEKQPVGRAVLFLKEEGDYSFSNFTSVLRILNKDELLYNFLYKYLLYVYIRGDTKSMQKATTVIHNIEFEKYLNIQVPIIPMDEQRRIVSYLDSSFKLIDEIKNKALKSLTEAKALFQSALAEAMEPKEGWEEKTLGECCDKINGLWKGKKPPFIYVGVIRNANFTKKMTLDFSNIEYLDVEVKQYNSRKLKRGDLIIEKSGGSEKQPVGRAVLFLKGDGEYSFSNFTSVLRIKNNEELNHYFLYYFLLYIYQRGDTKTMQKATTGIHNIEFEKYLNIKIPIMSLNEQRRIVSYLDKLSSKVRAIEEKYQKMVEECDALKQAMLRDVFE